MKVKRDQLIFEVFTKDGHEYKIYLNGKVTGFPEEGTLIVNHAAPIVTTLQGLIIEKERAIAKE